MPFSPLVAASNGRGVLYGTFALLRKMAVGEPIAALDGRHAPHTAVRWVNQWDNLDGSVERGYGGRSIFWENGLASADLARVAEYGRLLASLGINGCSINNVNADRRLLTPEFHSRVAAWWRSRTDALYQAVPDLAGLAVKADTEGRVGPSTDGRTHADAANVVARALHPHGGMLFYREPGSPLVAALEKTNRAIELQITQEYFGQARHLAFLVPMWKEALDFDLGTPVKDLAKSGFVGVANVGLDANWLGHPLSMANMYGFGRLAWDPGLSARRIAEEWTRQTFGPEPRVNQTIASMLLTSWRTYENYTGPLGLQT